MQRTERVIEIHAPVERVFDLFSDFESFPRWMSHIKDVRYTGRRYTRWTAEAPLGSSVEWEAETTRFEPDRLIAWRSVRGDVETEGQVVFQETGHATTLVRVMLAYKPPAGRLGALVARLFGTNPEQQLEEDLERFAEVVEGRRHRSSGSSSSRNDSRRAVRDERVYYEGPRGMRGRRRGYDDERALPPQPARRSRRDQEEQMDEVMRRYGELRREHRARRRREETERERIGPPPPPPQPPRVRRGERAPAEERRLYERRMRHAPPRRGEVEEDDRRTSAPRYALTPREREAERRERRLDHEYARRALSRGVDKLLDEQDAPSSRWRRRR